MKFPSSQTARQSRGNVQMSCRRSCIALLQSSKNTRPQPQLPTSLATTTKTYRAVRSINHFLLQYQTEGNQGGVLYIFLNTHFQKTPERTFRKVTEPKRNNRPQKTLQKCHFLKLNQCIGCEVMFGGCFIAERTRA